WKEKRQQDTPGWKEVLKAITQMPDAMKRLAVVQFLTWPGLFLMWFYYSTGVASSVFGGDPITNSDRYTEGLEYANATSAILNLVTFAFSFTIPFWVSKLGKKWTHSLCLLLGGLGLISVHYVDNPSWLYLSMGMVGIAWASILSMPYSLLAGVIPQEKMGIYMGVFNFFIVLPEIIAALTFGKIMENYLGNDRLLAVLIGGVLLLSAAVVCLLFVRERKS
ncbi:MAG: MFS transporter, partial [Bacteroidota bacterium]